MIQRDENNLLTAWDKIKRSRVELVMLCVVAVAVLFIPPEARMGLLGCSLRS